MERTTTETKHGLHVSVRRIHRRDLNRTWEFLKLVFRDVNRETVEYQRPRTKRRFFETYAQDGVEQLIFEVGKEIVGYAECAFDASGDDNWVNPRYFDNRGMRPLYIEELAVHPDSQGQGVGGFMLDQLQHLGRVRGCTHLVLEVAENNKVALGWYRRRNFYKLDAAIFMAQKLLAEPELLPPRKLSVRKARKPDAEPAAAAAGGEPAKADAPARPRRKARRAPEVVADESGEADDAAETGDAVEAVSHASKAVARKPARARRARKAASAAARDSVAEPPSRESAEPALEEPRRLPTVAGAGDIDGAVQAEATPRAAAPASTGPEVEVGAAPGRMSTLVRSL